MKIDFDKLRQEAENSRLAANGYVCKICRVEDIPDKECLKVYYDIAEGDFENHFTNYYDPCSYYPGIFYACYKESALSFFVKFITAVEESNSGYTFNGEEKELEGKLVGLILREEEYRNKNKCKETNLGVAEYVSVDAIRNGEFEIPDKKTLR